MTKNKISGETIWDLKNAGSIITPETKNSIPSNKKLN